MKADSLFDLASELAAASSAFFDIQGPSAGDKATAAFMGELRARSAATFGEDFAEKRICGANGLTVDYYFPDEATIVEVAMSLRNPTSEFERDILKAIMAQEAGHMVESLVFMTKPGGEKRCAQPGARAIIEWAKRAHGLAIAIREIQPLRSF